MAVQRMGRNRIRPCGLDGMGVGVDVASQPDPVATSDLAADFLADVSLGEGVAIGEETVHAVMLMGFPKGRRSSSTGGLTVEQLRSLVPRSEPAAAACRGHQAAEP